MLERSGGKRKPYSLLWECKLYNPGAHHCGESMNERMNERMNEYHMAPPLSCWAYTQRLHALPQRHLNLHPSPLLLFFTVARKENQLRCASTDEWIMKMYVLHRVEYYTAVKKEREFAGATSPSPETVIEKMFWGEGLCNPILPFCLLFITIST